MGEALGCRLNTTVELHCVLSLYRVHVQTIIIDSYNKILQFKVQSFYGIVTFYPRQVFWQLCWHMLTNILACICFSLFLDTVVDIGFAKSMLMTKEGEEHRLCVNISKQIARQLVLQVDVNQNTTETSKELFSSTLF